MAFKPSEINAFHVREGIKKLNESGKPLHNGTRWEVIIDGKSYPPKEVMRYAREQYDGSSDWPKGGGPATNDFLIKMGFNIKEIDSNSKNEIISPPYFKISDIWEYQKVSGTTYNSHSKEASWFYDTREKLYLLIGLLGTHLNEEFEIVYREQPNAQKGRGKILFKDYVLAGFAPKKENIKDHLFLKVSFTNLKLHPHFAVDLDMNFKDGKSMFHSERRKIYNNSLVEWKIDDSFPRNWNDLLELIGPEIEKLHQEFKKMIQNKENSISIPTSSLNQILYGPPGTGKTYHTVLEAAKIITGEQSISYDTALETFKTNLGSQIEFITFHQNYSYEDFIQGLRPDTENGNALTFEKKDGIFKIIADRALRNLEASKNPANAKKEFNTVFYELMQPLTEGDVDEIEIKMKKSSFHITEVGEKSIGFKKNIGNSEHTLSINTLRKMYDKGINDIILGGLQPYYNPILEKLLEKGKTQITTVDRKNFVIIIDEINRANISRVFGELITLIEEDKRSEGKIPLRVNLPSGDPFIVPSNLYIIGTMNTADKSIALLDIALRRRFEFVPMYPKYDGLEQTVYDADKLKKLNDVIVKRKNHDFTIGHAYFMGANYSFEKTMNHKVIPLLLEYFMNDEKEVIEICKEAGIEIGNWPLTLISN